MNLEIGQRVIHKKDMKEGIVVQIDDGVVKVVFDTGETSNIHSTFLAEKIDGLINDDRTFLTE